uniref:Peptide transporter, putative n=1 Tax=Arundo donax TaxID=35708 RepID=A0A0A9CBE2_ARUDO
MTLTASNDARDAGGTANAPMCLSIVLPCSRNVDENCARTAKNTIPVAQMGSIPMITFSSSICVTVQSLHGSESDSSSGDEITAALSRNLSTGVWCNLWPSAIDEFSVSSWRRVWSCGKPTFHFRIAATMTCKTLRIGLPSGFWTLYELEPNKKLAMASAMNRVGIQRPTTHPK